MPLHSQRVPLFAHTDGSMFIKQYICVVHMASPTYRNGMTPIKKAAAEHGHHRRFVAMQEFELDLGLDEFLQQLQDSRPRMAHLDELLENLTLDEFSSLFK